MREQLHYDWHWDWNTGNGDLGNMGIHYMDGCRWGLGQNTLPPHVMSLGGRFGYEDDGKTPNTQIIFLDYDPAPILFEVRGLPKSIDKLKATWRASDMDDVHRHADRHDHPLREWLRRQCDSGGGTTAYDNSDKLIQKFEPTSPDLRTNFLEARPQPSCGRPRLPRPAGPLLRRPRPLGNISYRLGKEIP